VRETNGQSDREMTMKLTLVLESVKNRTLSSRLNNASSEI